MGGFLRQSLRRCSATLPCALCLGASLLIPARVPGGEQGAAQAGAAQPGAAQVTPAGPAAGAGPACAIQSAARDTLGLAVEEIVFCAAIKDRRPAGVADTFPSDIYGVYCYTRLVGAVGPTSVTHVWYRGETRVAAKTLAVKASPWRTWSLKEMPEEWKGEWRVEVISPDGAVLASRKFVTR